MDKCVNKNYILQKEEWAKKIPGVGAYDTINSFVKIAKMPV